MSTKTIGELTAFNKNGIALIYRNVKGDYYNGNLEEWQPSSVSRGLARKTKFRDREAEFFVLFELDGVLKGVYQIVSDLKLEKVSCKLVCPLKSGADLRRAGGPSGRHLSAEEFSEILKQS